MAAGWNQFITADQQSDPGLHPDLQLGGPTTGQASQIGGRQTMACRQQQVITLAFIVGGSNPGAVGGLLGQGDRVVPDVHQLLRKHPAGAIRQGSTRENPNRFTVVQRCVEGVARGGPSFQAPGFPQGRLGGLTKGIAIHDRGAEARDSLRSPNLCGTDTAQGLLEWHGFRALDRCDCLQHPLARLLKGKPFASVGLSVSRHHCDLHLFA